MSNQSDFNTYKTTIEAVDPKDVKHPGMPIGIYLQEAEDLFAWSSEDKAILEQHGLDPSIIDQLPGLTGAARYAQSLWNSSRFSQEDAQKQFALLAPEAYDLKTRIIHALLFAYRKNPDLKGRVQDIADGTGDADMIQDLSDLSVHGKNNPEPLAAINFDMALLDEAANKSDELGSLLGVARGEAATDGEVKVMRDKSYTLLKQSVDEIREYGQFVFWRDENRAVGYASAYNRSLRSKSASDKQDEATVEIVDAP